MSGNPTLYGLCSSYTFWSQDLYYSYKLLRTSKNFCLYELHISIFATLEIKAEEISKYFLIHVKLSIINPIHVKHIFLNEK